MIWRDVTALLKIITPLPTYSIPTSRYNFTNTDWSAITNHLFSNDW